MRGILIFVLGVVFSTVAAAHPPANFFCAQAGTMNGWCEKCRVGYLATVEIRSARLFEALDPFGHDLEPEGMACQGCREAWAKDGFCYDCGIGYIGGLGYFTKLTYALARGEVVDPATITCPVCVQAARDRTLPLPEDAWCDTCGRGMVGNVAFRDRKDYAAARKQFALLLRAIKESERCETCAMLLFYGGVCPTCHITYKNGKVVEKE